VPGLLPNVDPQGLLEYSVVYTDRALNHMSLAFQGAMKEISATLKRVYNARSAIVVPGSGTFGMEASRASSPPAASAWSSATAGSASAGARSSTWAPFRRKRSC